MFTAKRYYQNERRGVMQAFHSCGKQPMWWKRLTSTHNIYCGGGGHPFELFFITDSVLLFRTNTLLFLWSQDLVSLELRHCPFLDTKTSAVRNQDIVVSRSSWTYTYMENLQPVTEELISCKTWNHCFRKGKKPFRQAWLWNQSGRISERCYYQSEGVSSERDVWSLCEFACWWLWSVAVVGSSPSSSAAASQSGSFRFTFSPRLYDPRN